MLHFQAEDSCLIRDFEFCDTNQEIARAIGTKTMEACRARCDKGTGLSEPCFYFTYNKETMACILYKATAPCSIVRTAWPKGSVVSGPSSCQNE